MKIKLWFFLFLLVLGGCGGGGGGGGHSSPGSVSPSPTPTPTPSPTPTPTPTPTPSNAQATARGTTLGSPVSAVIGSDGGSISSSDGSISIEIPVATLDQDTTITVQEITNQAHGGIGRAFRIGPEGLHTDTPMTIRFHASAEMLTGSALTFASIAFQDDNGFWHVYNQPNRDAIHSDLEVETTHFSDWSAVTGVQLRPGDASVNTGTNLDLQIMRCVQEGIGEDDPFVSILDKCDIAPLESFSARHWAVNGSDGGDSVSGFIVADADISSGKAVFTAPADVPAANPVAVSVQVMDIDDPSASTTLVSNITIVQTLDCSSWRQREDLSADVGVSPFSWSDTSDDQSYEGHQQGHLITTLRNILPAAGRDMSPVGIWSSQNKPVSGYVSMEDTHRHFYPEQTVTMTGVGAGLPNSAAGAPSVVTLIVDYQSCVYELVADFTVQGVVTVDGASSNAVLGVGGIYFRQAMTQDEAELGEFSRDNMNLPAQYDSSTKANGYYAGGQNDVLRAAGATAGHWSIAVAP